MSKYPTIKAQFPIGKTQWNKWTDDQRIAFNEARAAGVPYADAIKGANQTQPAKPASKVEAPKVEKKHHGLLGAIEDVADIVEDVAETVVAVAPVVSVAKAAVKVVGKKGK